MKRLTEDADGRPVSKGEAAVRMALLGKVVGCALGLGRMASDGEILNYIAFADSEVPDGPD